MTERIAAAVAAMILVMLAPTGIAHADDAHRSGAYATASQPKGCTVGKIHLQYVAGTTWTLGGVAVTVNPPGRDFAEPGGFNGNAVITMTDAQAAITIPLKVAAVAASCVPPDYRDWVVGLRQAATDHLATIATQARTIDRQHARIDHLRNHVGHLRAELRRCHRHGC